VLCDGTTIKAAADAQAEAVASCMLCMLRSEGVGLRNERENVPLHNIALCRATEASRHLIHCIIEKHEVSGFQDSSIE